MTKDQLLKSTLDDLNRLYSPGLYEFLYMERADLFSQLQSIESNIDSVFLTGSMDNLKQALRNYWAFHMQALKEFKGNENIDDMTKARQEMIGYRINA